MPTVVEAIKNFRSKTLPIPHGNDVWSHDVKWDLGHFLYEPMNQATYKKLSNYVDDQLKEYSKIYNTTPVVNLPRALARYEDEHVSHDSSETYVRGGYLRHLTIRLPVQYECPNWNARSYVTSYQIDQNSLAISARVLTAPAGVEISHQDWYHLCVCDENSDNNQAPPSNEKEAVHQTVKANLVILSKSRARPVHAESEQELVSLTTLRETISEQEYRRFVKHGFILVKGASGDVFQIFRDQNHTRVWRGGKVIEEVCVRIHHNAKTPPTDNLIAFKAIIEAENGEDEFRRMGNVYRMAS